MRHLRRVGNRWLRSTLPAGSIEFWKNACREVGPFLTERRHGHSSALLERGQLRAKGAPGRAPKLAFANPPEMSYFGGHMPRKSSCLGWRLFSVVRGQHKQEDVFLLALVARFSGECVNLNIAFCELNELQNATSAEAWQPLATVHAASRIHRIPEERLPRSWAFPDGIQKPTFFFSS